MTTELLNGYSLVDEFKLLNGGRCMWAFATKNDEEFFIKRYLTPRIPVEGSLGSEKTKEQKRRICDAFEKRQITIQKAIASRAKKGGNVIIAVDFFRWGTYFYKVTEKVADEGIMPGDIANLPLSQRLLFLLGVIGAVDILHSANIVHGDLKPDNILVKKKDDRYIPKLIDFDDSYFAHAAPDKQKKDEYAEIVGTIDFFSPEQGALIRGDSTIKANQLDLAGDVFALGVVFSHYLTGNKPEFDQKKYNYAWEAALAGDPPIIPKIRESTTGGSATQIDTEALAKLINTMYSTKPSDRPTLSRLMANLKEIRDKPVSSPGKSPGKNPASSPAKSPASSPAKTPVSTEQPLQEGLFINFKSKK